MSEVGSWGILTAAVGCGGYGGVRGGNAGYLDWTGIYDGTSWTAAQTMIHPKSGLNGVGLGSTSDGMLTQGYLTARTMSCEEFSSNIGIWVTKELGYT